MKFNGKNVRIHNPSNSVLKPSFTRMPLDSLTRMSVIRNNDIPSCKNCIHYRPKLLIDGFVSSFNKCDKFGEKDTISGEIQYDFVSTCRSDESKCGKEGREFEKEPDVFLKQLKHTILRPNTIGIVIVVYLIGYSIANLH